MREAKFEVKFANTPEEIAEVCKLRYEDLVMEYSTTELPADGNDFSPFDEYAQHLIVKELATGKICGYYRMITSLSAVDGKTFVCEAEYNLDKLKQTGENICEFSRAVIKKEFRGGVVLLLMWKFILDYMTENNFRYLVGDASFKGTDRERYREEISYLINNYCIDPSLEITSRDKLPPMEISDTSNLDGNEILRRLPPLIRGYVNVGAKVAAQPFVDFPFGSVDVFVLVDLKNCNEAYVQRLRRV